MAVQGVDLRNITAGQRDRLQNRLLNAQTDQYDRQVTDQNKLRELVPDAMSGNQPAASEVMGINPELGMKIQSHLGSMDASRRETAMKEAPLAAQLLEGVTDQSSYESAREKAMQMDRAYGTNLSKGFLPPNFDPQRTQQQPVSYTHLTLPTIYSV